MLSEKILFEADFLRLEALWVGPKETEEDGVLLLIQSGVLSFDLIFLAVGYKRTIWVLLRLVFTDFPQNLVV